MLGSPSRFLKIFEEWNLRDLSNTSFQGPGAGRGGRAEEMEGIFKDFKDFKDFKALYES